MTEVVDGKVCFHLMAIVAHKSKRDTIYTRVTEQIMQPAASFEVTIHVAEISPKEQI